MNDKKSPYAGPADKITIYSGSRQVEGYLPDEMEIALLLSQHKIMSGHQLRVRFWTPKSKRAKIKLDFLVETGLLARYELLSLAGTRLPYLYGVGPVAVENYRLSPIAGQLTPDRVLNCVIANQLYIRLWQLTGTLSRFVIEPTDYLTAKFVYNDIRFSVICLRDNQDQDSQLAMAVKNIGPSDKRILLVGTSEQHVERLAGHVSGTNLAVRYTTDQNLYGLPLSDAFMGYRNNILVSVSAGLFKETPAERVVVER